MVDFGPASKGMGIGIGIIGMGIGLRFMSDTVEDMRRNSKSKTRHPTFKMKTYNPKPLKWKL